MAGVSSIFTRFAGPPERRRAGLTTTQMLAILLLLLVLAAVVIWKKENERRQAAKASRPAAAGARERAKPKVELKYETVEAAQVVPDDAFLFFTVPNIRSVRDNLMLTSVYGLWREPTVKDFLAQPLDKLQGVIDRAEANLGVGLAVLKRVFLGQVSVALLAGDKSKKLEVVFVADCKAERAQFEDIVQALMKKIFPPVSSGKEGTGGKWESYDVSGVKVMHRASARGTVCYAYLGDTFVLTLSKRRMEQVIQNSQKKDKARVLANNARFKEVIGRLEGEKQIARLYVNISLLSEKLLDKLAPGMSEKATAAGLKSIKAVGYGVRFEGGGIKEVFYISSPKIERRGFAKLLNWPAGKKDLLEMVPAEAVSFSHANIDFVSLWDGLLDTIRLLDEGTYNQIQTALASAEKRTKVNIKEDLLASLGNEIVSYVVAPPEEEPTRSPSTVFMLSLKDKAKAARSIEILLSSVIPGAAIPIAVEGKALPATRDRYWAITQHRNHSIKVLTSRTKELPITPAYSVVGDVMILCPDTESVRVALNFIDEKGPSILEDSDYKRVAAGLSADSATVSYFDLKASVALLQRKMKEMGSDIAKLGLPVNFAKLPPEEVLAKHIFGMGSDVVSDDAGLTLETYSPLGNVGSLVGTGALAAVMLPVSVNIKERITMAMSKRNFTTIGKAMRAYAMKHDGNLPPPGKQAEVLLKEGFIKSPKVFYSPATDADPRTFPDNVSYQFTILTYNLNTDGEGRYPIVWDLLGNHPGGRHVLFIDGHVEFLTEEAFLRRIDNP